MAITRRREDPTSDPGGHYIYLRDAWGPLPAFLYGWALFLIIATGAIAAVAMTGANYMQSVTGAAHFGRAVANGRVRPYGVVGGGINFVNLGQKLQPDFGALFNLPLNTQNQINTCANALPNNPTVAQVQACNVPLMAEEVSGVRGLLTRFSLS